ncbi:hypothetical protein [Cellulomonas denverensis]|nr:hypothetical protein Cde04nite_12670 [Cellulomonas denverensis]
MGPAAALGHEELNEVGEIELHDKLVNRDPDDESADDSNDES